MTSPWTSIRTFLENHRKAAAAAALVGAFLLGYAVHGERRPELLAPTPEQLEAIRRPPVGLEDALFACPMVCVPPLESPGDCPVCGMELFPVPKQDSLAGPPRLELDRHSVALARIRTSPVERRAVQATVNSFGQVVAGLDGLMAGAGLMLKLFVYESDAARFRLGQQVTFVTQAYPGEVFTGTVNFVGMFVDPYTRTITVGVSYDDPRGRLIPGMLAVATLRSEVAAEGGGAPLVIPESAPLITGKRAVVYVAVPGEVPVFEGREVELGERADGYFVVRDGLLEGEEVVTNGAFRIDSSMQIKAKPGMLGGGAR